LFTDLVELKVPSVLSSVKKAELPDLESRLASVLKRTEHFNDVHEKGAQHARHSVFKKFYGHLPPVMTYVMTVAGQGVLIGVSWAHSTEEQKFFQFYSLGSDVVTGVNTGVVYVYNWVRGGNAHASEPHGMANESCLSQIASYYGPVSAWVSATVGTVAQLANGIASHQSNWEIGYEAGILFGRGVTAVVTGYIFAKYVEKVLHEKLHSRIGGDANTLHKRAQFLEECMQFITTCFQESASANELKAEHERLTQELFNGSGRDIEHRALRTEWEKVGELIEKLCAAPQMDGELENQDQEVVRKELKKIVKEGILPDIKYYILHYDQHLPHIPLKESRGCFSCLPISRWCFEKKSVESDVANI
jgi:hypothetical protein